MAAKSDYSEHAVAFIDLLGFSDAVQHQSRADDILMLLKAFAQLRGDGSAETEEIIDPKQLLVPPKRTGFPNLTFAMAGQRTSLRPAVTAFSDSIVISFRLEELQKHKIECGDALHFLNLIVSYLAWNALEIGLLVRGGITLGQLYHEDDVVVGAGLIEAYELENKIASYPRVILSKRAVEHPTCKPIISHLSYIDYDGMPCLDYMPNALQKIRAF